MLSAIDSERTSPGRGFDGYKSWPQVCSLGVELNMLRAFKVEPETTIRLATFDPSYGGGNRCYPDILEETLFELERIDQLQSVMYAEQKHSLLIILQGLDAAGKDGVVRHILRGINPAGCRVISFKQPTLDELGHDFLWRVHKHVPAKGQVAIFNRSHYEDVLVVRVHERVPSHVWSKRYELINNFERLLLLENQTTVLKFLLHISKDEQLARFRRRLEDPTRRWKISESDYEEREYWDQYVAAFEHMLRRTSTKHAPWFVIPSDDKWFRDLLVSKIIRHALEDLNMQAPSSFIDIGRIRRRYHMAEIKAKAS